MIFNDGGLIDRANLAKQKALLADYEERIKIIVADEKTGKIIEKKTDKLIDLVKARLEKEDWVATVENVVNEPKQLRVTTVDKYVIVVEIDEDGTVKIIEEGPDNGEPYPSLTLTQIPLEGTENEKIKIKVEAEVEKTTKTKKVTTVRIVKPESMKQEKEYAEGGVIFEVTENGVYTFEAETNMGKTKRKTIEINISKPESDIEITSEPITPRNTKETGTQNGIAKGPINVEIKYGDNSYIKQYRKETDESWTEVNGTTANFTVTENIAIFAKYSDGTNSLKTVTYNVQNVDNESPNSFNVTETHTTNSITVGASTTDTASAGASSTIAGILRYEYRIYKNSAWEEWQTANVFTGLTTGTYKVQAKAIDKAGNETVSSESANITLGTVSTEDIKVSSSPTTPRNTGTAGTQNGVAKGPIAVNITYGNSSYTRQYKIGTSGSWTNVTGTTASFTVTENVAVFARYFDGTNGFQTQAYNVQNVDNVVPTISSYNATVSKNVITATCTATDTASTGASNTTAGILRYEYSNGGTTYQTSNTFTVSKAGTYTIYMKAIDKAGNQTIVNKQVTVSSYTVTYNANGGSGAPASQTAISGINLTLSSTVPTRSGYTFLGWSTSSTATTATYSAGATYTANASTTLYAVWEAIDPIKVISFSGSPTGDVAKTEEVTLEKGKYFFFVDGTSYVSGVTAGAVVTYKTNSVQVFSAKESKNSNDYDDIQIYYRYDIDVTETTTFNVRVFGKGTNNSFAGTKVCIYPASKKQSVVKEIEYKGKTENYTVTNSSGQTTGGGIKEIKSIYIPASGYKITLNTIGSDASSAPSYYCSSSTSLRSETGVDILKKVSGETGTVEYESTSAGWVTIGNSVGSSYYGTKIVSITNPNGEDCSLVTTSSTGY